MAMTPIPTVADAARSESVLHRCQLSEEIVGKLLCGRAVTKVDAREQTAVQIVRVSGYHSTRIRHGGEIVVRVIGLHRPLAIGIGLAKLQPSSQIVFPRGRVALQSARVGGNHLACGSVRHRGSFCLPLHSSLQFTHLDRKIKCNRLQEIVFVFVSDRATTDVNYLPLPLVPHLLDLTP